MSLQYTGVLTGSWNQSFLAEGYYVDIYKNDIQYDSLTLVGGANTSFQYTGFTEGESGFAKIRSYSGNLTSSNFLETGHKYFNTENFHTTSGSGLYMEDFSIDLIETPAYSSASGYVATGSYPLQNINIKFDLRTPRDNTSVTEFHQEPFISNGQYIIYSEAQSYFTGSLLTNEFLYTNTVGKRNIYSKIIVNDTYDKSITGILHLNNEAPKITNVVTRLNDYSIGESGYGVSGRLGIYPQISGQSSQQIHYSFSYDTDFTGFFKNVSTQNLHNYSTDIPLGTGVYLKAIAEDFIGSGNIFYLTGNLSKPTGTSTTTSYPTIDSFSSLINENYKNFTFSTLTKELQQSGDYVSGTRSPALASGYYYKISVDPSSTGYLNGDSYFTGILYGDTGATVNLFDSRSTSQEHFYSTLKLHKSGQGNTVYDTKSISGIIPYPSIINTGYSLGYENGVTNFQFTTNFPTGSTFLQYIISGEGQPSYATGLSYNSFSTGVKDASVNIKLVKSSDHTSIYGQATISSSGVQPILGVERNQLTDLDGTIPIAFRNINEVPITGFHLFRKPIITSLTGVGGTGSAPLSSSFSGLLSVTPSSSNLISYRTNLGAYYDRIISSVKASQNYTGYNETGGLFYYNSGNNFEYIAIPYNGYGSGSYAATLKSSFPINAFTTDIRGDTNTNISQISSVSSDVSSVTTSITNTGSTVYTHLSGTSDTLSSKISNTESTLNSSISTLSGVSLFTTGSSQNITGTLSVGSTSNNTLFEVHGTGSHINSDLNISGKLNVTGRIQIGGNRPSSSTDPGNPGQIAYDANYFYVCTGTNQWGRVEISNW